MAKTAVQDPPKEAAPKAEKQPAKIKTPVTLEKFSMELHVVVEATNRGQAQTMLEQKVRKLQKSWGVKEAAGKLL